MQQRILHSNEYEQFHTIFTDMDESDTVECKKTDTKGGRQCDYYLVIMCRTLCDHSVLFHLSVYLFLCKYHNVLVIKTSKELSGNIRPPALFFSKIVLEKARAPLHFRLHFYIRLSITTQKPVGILFEIALVWF